MKAAILGTNDYHATMQQVAKNTLQRQAGYMPQVAEGINGVGIPSVSERFTKYAAYIIQALACIHNLTDYNPRSPYVYLAWSLIGLDNPYRINRYAHDDTTHRRTAFHYLRIALGDEPKTDKFVRLLGYSDMRVGDIAALDVHFPEAHIYAKARDIRNDLVADASYRVVEHLNDYAQELASANYQVAGSFTKIRLTVGCYLADRMRQWMCLSDEELLPIIRQLTLDVLEVKV